jgi:hypothetical protein
LFVQVLAVDRVPDEYHPPCLSPNSADPERALA